MPRRRLQAPADLGQFLLKLGAVDHVALVFAEGLAQLFDVVAAFLVVFFAQDRDDAAGVVHRDRMSGDFLKFFGQRRVQPRGDEAPLRVLGQVQEFRLAPDQPYVGPRRLIGIGRRVQHGHFPALAGKPVCQRGARYAPAYDDDILFCRAHGRMPPAAGLPPGPARKRRVSVTEGAGGNDSPRTPSERRTPRLRRAVRRPVGVRRLLGESLTYPLCVFQIIPVPITKVLGEGGVGFEEGATFLQKGSPFPPQVSDLFF